MSALLHVQNLSLQQGGQTLLKNLNLTIQSGECWALLGRNGSGKTTLLHTLAGVRPVAQGNIAWQEQPLTQLPARQRAQNIGLLTQDASEGFEATVLEAVLVGRHPHIARFDDASAEDEAIAHQALLDCGLRGFETRTLTSLSGGERRRLALATLLTQNPRLLLLDEPLNHLDMQWQWCVLQQLRTLAAQDRALMLSLHDPNMALRFCTHALLLDGQGGWIAGEIDRVLTVENIYAAYGFQLRLLRDGNVRWLVPELAPVNSERIVAK